MGPARRRHCLPLRPLRQFQPAPSNTKVTPTSTPAPSTDVWHLAEGYTGSGFSTFILIMNANSSAASVDVTYMLDSGTNVTKTHTVPANSRYTIVAGDADQAGSDQAFGTKLVSDQEIVVERAMYWTNGGHVTAGIQG